jgi:hypothetical protein
VWICLRDVAIVKPAHAQDTMNVRIVGISSSITTELPVDVENTVDVEVQNAVSVRQYSSPVDVRVIR